MLLRPLGGLLSQIHSDTMMSLEIEKGILFHLFISVADGNQAQMYCL